MPFPEVTSDTNQPSAVTAAALGSSDCRYNNSIPPPPSAVSPISSASPPWLSEDLIQLGLGDIFGVDSSQNAPDRPSVEQNTVDLSLNTPKFSIPSPHPPPTIAEDPLVAESLGEADSTTSERPNESLDSRLENESAAPVLPSNPPSTSSLVLNQQDSSESLLTSMESGSIRLKLGGASRKKANCGFGNGKGRTRIEKQSRGKDLSKLQSPNVKRSNRGLWGLGKDAFERRIQTLRHGVNLILNQNEQFCL